MIIFPHPQKSFIPLTVLVLIFTLLMPSISRGEGLPDKSLNKVKTIRFGSHPNFSRLVIDMESKASLKVQEDSINKTVLLSFSSTEGMEKKDWGYRDKIIKNISTMMDEGKQSWQVFITHSTGEIKWKKSYLDGPPRWFLDFSQADKSLPNKNLDKTQDKPETKKNSIHREGEKSASTGLTPDRVKKQAEEAKKPTVQAKPYWESHDKVQGSSAKSSAGGASGGNSKIVKPEPQQLDRGKNRAWVPQSPEVKENNPINKPKGEATQAEDKSSPDSVKDKEQEALETDSFHRAMALEKAGKTLEAGVAYKLFLEAFPGSKWAIKAHIGLGDVHFTFKDLDDALAEYKIAYNAASELEEAALKKVSFRIAEILYRADQTNEDVMTFYLSSLKRWPDYTDLSPQCIYNLGEILYQQGNYAKAREIFLFIINIYPKDEIVPRALQRTGDSYLSEGLREMASKSYEEILKRFPDNAKVVLEKVRLAELAYGNKVKDLKPLEAFQDAANKDYSGFGEVALEKKAAILIKEGKYPEAHQVFKEMINRFPKGEGVRKNLPQIAENLVEAIKSLFEDKNYHDIITLYEQNQDIVRNIHHEHYYRAVSESGLKLGNLEVAEKVLHEALQENGFPRDWVYLKLAELNLEKQEYSAADRLLKTLKEKQPQSKLLPEAHIIRGEAYFVQNKYREAAAQYQSALDLGGKMPDRIPVLYRMAVSLSAIKNWTGAAEAFQKVIRAANDESGDHGFPNLPNAYFALGESLLAQGKKEEARSLWQEALRLFPKHEKAVEVTYKLGVLEKGIGKQREAVDIFQQLAKANGREFWGKAAAQQLEELEWREKLGSDLTSITSRLGK